MKNVLEFSKQLLLENLCSDAIVVDATVGNGNDTVYLCENYKFVYGFDIQQQAIDRTQLKLKEYDNYQLICDSHANVCKYLTKCDGAIFNLGYLPNSDLEVKTCSKSTLNSISNLLTIIEKGIIVVVVYIGHDNGEEGNDIENYLENLSSRYSVIKYSFLNRKNAPYILAIKVK